MEDLVKLIRIVLKEAEQQLDKYGSGTARHNDWTREVQRLKNIIHRLTYGGASSGEEETTQANYVPMNERCGSPKRIY